MTHTEAMLTRWSRAQRHALDKRNGMIRQAAAAGMTQRAIGELVGLSHTAVARICREAKP